MVQVTSGFLNFTAGVSRLDGRDGKVRVNEGLVWWRQHSEGAGGGWE